MTVSVWYLNPRFQYLCIYTEMSKSSSIKVRSDLYSNQSCFSMKLVRHNPTWVDAATSTWEKPICGWSGGVGALNWYYFRRWKKMSKGMMVIWRVESLINWYCIDCIKSPIHNTQIEVHLRMKFIHEWKLPMWLHLQFHNYKRAFLCWERIFYLLIEKTKKKFQFQGDFPSCFIFNIVSCENFETKWKWN